MWVEINPALQKIAPKSENLQGPDRELNPGPPQYGKAVAVHPSEE